MDVNIALLAGDGIGPEIIAEATKVLDRVAAKFGHRFDYREALVGACAIDATGDPYPDETHAICQAADAVLFGAIGDPKYDNDPKAPVNRWDCSPTCAPSHCSTRWPAARRSRQRWCAAPISSACAN